MSLRNNYEIQIYQGIDWAFPYLSHNCFLKAYIYCSITLRASSMGRSGGGAVKGRRACNYVSEISIPPLDPLWRAVDWAVRFPPIRAMRKRARMSSNIEKHVPRVMTSFLMKSPPISISHRLFRCRYLNSRDVVALFPFPAPLSERPGELAWRLKVVSREISNFNTRREIFYLRAA